VWGVWGVWGGVWGGGGVGVGGGGMWGVWDVWCVGCVGCGRCGGVGSLLTFDIPQTALVATLDTYDLVEIIWDNITKEILKLFAGATMNNFQIDIAFKNNKNAV
jgi:hypothetical protein